MELQQVKCPNCGSPAGIDDDNCNYCFARIPRVGGSATNNLLVGIAFAFVVGVLAADWYLGTGLTEWLVNGSKQGSD